MTLDFTRIGQIGLGYMGSALAKRLRELGKTTIGHDTDAGGCGIGHVFFRS